MKDNRWFTIVNPNAGSSGVMEKWNDVKRMLAENGIESVTVFTKHRYHAVELAIQGVRDGFRRFLSIGGDGTLHEVVNGLFLQKEVSPEEFTVAAVSVGSGNDWVRMIDRVGDTLHNILSLKEGRTVKQDVVKVSYEEAGVKNCRYMMNVGGVGFDANVCYICNKMKEHGRKGKMVYLKALFRALVATGFRKVRVRVDGMDFFKGRFFSMAVSNGRYSGGGMCQTPDASFNDGLLNIMMIRRILKIKVPFHVKKLYNDMIYSLDEVVHTTGKSASVETDRPCYVEVDGEVIGNTPVTFEVMPAALNVIVGPDFGN